VKHPVLDQGWIEVKQVFGSDATIAAAARSTRGALPDAPRDDRRTLEYLVRKDHTSVFEHAGLQLEMFMPEVVHRHFMTHRVGWSRTVQSGRKVATQAVYTPTNWRGRVTPENAALLTEAFEEHKRYCAKRVAWAVSLGVPLELARVFDVAHAPYKTVLATCNVRALMHFLRLRLAPGAQHEVRQYAHALYTHALREYFPLCAAAFDAHPGGVSPQE